MSEYSAGHGPSPAALARIFVMKIGVLPERVLVPLLNDRMVAKGTILAFVTDFFVDFLATGSVDDLVRRLGLFLQQQAGQLVRSGLQRDSRGVDAGNGRIAAACKVCDCVLIMASAGVS